MSFSKLVKEEIASTKIDICNIEAQIIGLLLFGLKMKNGGFSYSNKYLFLIRKIAYIIKDYTTLNIKVQKTQHSKGTSKYTITFSDKKLETLLNNLTVTNLHILKAMLDTDEKKQILIQIAFLLSGTINDPRTSEYHMEIRCKTETNGLLLQGLINHFGLDMKIIRRRNDYIVYSKNSNYISDFLYLIGAVDSRLVFEDEKIKNDYSANLNRMANCGSYNDIRAIEAAIIQVQKFQKLKRTVKFVALPEEYRRIVDIRLKNKEASLQELTDSYNALYATKLSRSSLNRRIQKLLSL